MTINLIKNKDTKIHAGTTSRLLFRKKKATTKHKKPSLKMSSPRHGVNWVMSELLENFSKQSMSQSVNGPMLVLLFRETFSLQK